MMHFKGCTCSVCNQPFQNGDDIVVCPECGAPYHRACYAKEGHCVYEARHGNGFEYQPPATAGGGNRCGNCGADNPMGNLFCENCGTPLREQTDAQQPSGQPQRIQPQQISRPGAAGGMNPNAFDRADGPEQAFQSMFDAATIGREYDGIASADWMQFIGKSAPYYLFQFARMDETNRKSSICWSALFIAPFYFAYRKMWGWAAASLLGTLVTSIPSFLVMLQTLGVSVGFTLSAGALNALMMVGMVLSWGMSIFFGVFAFYLYRQHGAKKIRALRERMTVDAPTAQQEALTRAGGTSFIGVAALFLICMLMSSAFVFWVGPEKVSALYNMYY